MNSRFMTALSLGALIAVPAFAQRTNLPPGAAPAAKPATKAVIELPKNYVSEKYGALANSEYASPTLKELVKWAARDLPLENLGHLPATLVLGRYLWKTDIETLKYLEAHPAERSEALYDEMWKVAGDALKVAVYSPNMREKEAGIDLFAGVMTAMNKGFHMKELDLSVSKSGLGRTETNDAINYASHIINYVTDLDINAEWRDYTVNITRKLGGKPTTTSGLEQQAIKLQGPAYNKMGNAIGKAMDWMLSSVTSDMSPLAYRYAPSATGRPAPKGKMP